jgi:acyl carrier protein
MDDKAILAKLTGIFQEVLDDPSVALSPNTTADDVNNWDSMNHIAIVVQTERRFGVKFHTAEIEELRNVGDFVRLIGIKLDKVQR